MGTVSPFIQASWAVGFWPIQRSSRGALVACAAGEAGASGGVGGRAVDGVDAFVSFWGSLTIV